MATSMGIVASGTVPSVTDEVTTRTVTQQQAIIHQPAL